MDGNVVSRLDVNTKGIQWGAKSFKPVVRLPRDGKPCRLKRHFEGCLRQVVGYIEFLAAKDRESFVFVKVETLPGKLTPHYSLRHLKRSLAWLESSGVIQRARRKRNEHDLNGWLVLEHDEISKTEGNRCIIAPRLSPCMSPFSAEHVTQNGPACHPACHPEEGFHVTFSDSDHVTLDDPQLEEDEDTYFDDTEEFTRLFSAELPRLSPCQPLESKSQSKEEPREQRTAGADASLSAPREEHDFDLPRDASHHEPQPKAGRPAAEPASGDCGAVPNSAGADESQPLPKWQTVGQVFGDWLAAAEDFKVLGAISEYEFQYEFAERENYEHTARLAQCCLEQVELIRDERFERWKTPAQLMAGAMESMRKFYGLDVPRGWYPAIKRLREKKYRGGKLQ